MRVLFSIFILLVITLGCSNMEPRAIAYGNAECAHCSMMVTDQKFGAELITDKGRYYFFDSAECMFEYMAEDENSTYSHILITPFLQPSTLADAKTSFFLISEGIPSPMGASLSAYSTLEEAKTQATMHGGEVYNYSQILDNYKIGAGAAQQPI